MASLFRGTMHARIYQKYRSEYPGTVFNTILKYLAAGLDRRSGQKQTRFGTALDVGCGTGISTMPLCSHFNSVIGVDVSEAQLEEARRASAGHANVTYRLGFAHELAFQADCSVDLITIAQAMHWVDTEKFYRECHRLLRPRGVLAAYGYGVPRVRNPAANDAVLHFHNVTLNGFWESGRRHVVDCYTELHKDFVVAFPTSERIDSLILEKTYSLDDFLGYLQSWSAYQMYRQRLPEAEDPLVNIAARLRQIYSATNVKKNGDRTSGQTTESVAKTDDKSADAGGIDKPTGVTGNDSEIQMSVTSPIFILLGRKTVSS